MKKEKRNKGITLIALIITIIVMLILVGVSVNVALNGGLFDTAKTAASETQIESEKETLQAAIIGSLDEDLKVENADTLKGNLPEGWTVTGKATGRYTVISPKENEFTVYENGDIGLVSLSEYGFYYNAEYICYDYVSSERYNETTFIVLEDGALMINSYYETNYIEGGTADLYDVFDNTKLLTIESLEYNKKYTVIGTLDSQYTYYYDDNGYAYCTMIIDADKINYSDKTIDLGGKLDIAFSENGKSMTLNGKTFTIEE